MTSENKDRVLAVGERANRHEGWEPAVRHTDSFDLRLRLGFYDPDGPGTRRAFLTSLGVRWDDGINLLWPSPTPGEWDAREATRVVGVLRARIEEYGTVLLFGARVSRAFGVRFVPFERQGVYVPMPHPSERCRTWNDCEFLNEVRRHFRERVTRHGVERKETRHGAERKETRRT